MKQSKATYKDLNKLVNAFTVYKFIKDMTTPFKEMEWFSLGYIDDRGRFLRDNKDIPAYDRLIINLKKLIDKIPDPYTRVRASNFVTAINLYAEDIERLGGNSTEVLSEVFDYMNEQGIDLNEMMAVGNVNAISGVSPNPDNPDNLPDVFLSKSAQRRHVLNSAKTIIRRKKHK